MSEEQERPKTKLELRAERKAAQAKAEDAQRDADLEAIDDLEMQFGDSNISILEIPFTGDGVPVRVAVRTPRDAEVSRYRSRVKSEDKSQLPVAAAELGESCVVYPKREIFEKLAAGRPNLKVDCGAAALRLSMAKASSEGKG